MSSSYAYLPISAADAQRAWREFESRSADCASLQSVHFVPTLGGSFVVVETRERGWLDGRGFGRWRLGTNARAVLQRFSAFLLSSSG